MKKITVLILLFLFSAQFSFAQTPTISPSPTPIKVNYSLPHPGILPDHPLYKIKVLRDKVMLFLTRDPNKKVLNHLNLADKRIQMASDLVDKGNIELAKGTALKGENEYTNLVNTLKDARIKPSKDLFEKLRSASLKHQEVLLAISSKVDKNDKKTFEDVIYFSKVNFSEIEKIYKNF